uniref:Uncharacterized protein n=1 Tax=Panthera tigris altaica TaxID=74533 RepID=A0A8C9JWN3_PANTA
GALSTRTCTNAFSEDSSSTAHPRRPRCKHSEQYRGLCFNGSAFVLYLSAAVVDASSFFAFLVTICYAGNTYFSFIAWRSRTIQ